MSDKRTEKRWKREHGKRTEIRPKKLPVPKGYDRIKLVYSPKTEEEGLRRWDRTEKLVGTPFIRLPGNPDPASVLFISKDGTPVTVAIVEMVFNDALLMDAVSNWGEDGPLTKDTYDDELHPEVYEYAQKAYAGVEIPPQLRRPS